MNSEKVTKAKKKSILESAPGASENIVDVHLELRILQSLRRIIRAVEIHSRKLATNHQITGHQLVCLLMINEYGPIAENAVARLSQLSNSTVVGILDRLEEKGLVKRERSIQ